MYIYDKCRDIKVLSKNLNKLKKKSVLITAFYDSL